MEEKVIVKSKLYDIHKFRKICVIVGAILFALAFVFNFVDSYTKPWNDDTTFAAYLVEYLVDTFTDLFWLWWNLGIPAIFFVVPAVFGFVVHAWLSQIELIVTDKRVYGTAGFGTRVDLPFDSISAIGTGWPKGIEVATSSGKISFLAIKNCDEIHKVMSDLLIARQNKKPSVAHTTIKQEVPQSNADELRKYKELLDLGVISQEEFDAKKKQLLGL